MVQAEDRGLIAGGGAGRAGACPGAEPLAGFEEFGEVGADGAGLEERAEVGGEVGEAVVWGAARAAEGGDLGDALGVPFHIAAVGIDGADACLDVGVDAAGVAGFAAVVLDGRGVAVAGLEADEDVVEEEDVGGWSVVEGPVDGSGSVERDLVDGGGAEAVDAVEVAGDVGHDRATVERRVVGSCVGEEGERVEELAVVEFEDDLGAGLVADVDPDHGLVGVAGRSVGVAEGAEARGGDACAVLAPLDAEEPVVEAGGAAERGEALGVEEALLRERGRGDGAEWEGGGGERAAYA